MKHLLVVWHSQSGHTEALVRAACAGARQEIGVELRERRALQATLDDLLWAEALLLATPENFGYMSGATKDFLDRTYYPAQGRVDGLPYALLISADNDGRGAVSAIERIALGYRWKAVTEPLIVRGPPDDSALAAASELGAGLAAGLVSGVF